MFRIEIDKDALETGRKMIIYSHSRKSIHNDKYFYTSMRRDSRDIFIILFLNFQQCDKMTKNLEDNYSTLILKDHRIIRFIILYVNSRLKLLG